MIVVKQIASENIPELGTVCNPAVYFDGCDAYVCYEASVRERGGNVVLKFEDVIEFRLTPINVEGLKQWRYPIEPLAFNEISGGDETSRWATLNPKFWLISFRDVTVEVLFDTVSTVKREAENRSQHDTLIEFLRA